MSTRRLGDNFDMLKRQMLTPRVAKSLRSRV